MKKAFSRVLVFSFLVIVCVFFLPSRNTSFARPDAGAFFQAAQSRGSDADKTAVRFMETGDDRITYRGGRSRHALTFPRLRLLTKASASGRSGFFLSALLKKLEYVAECVASPAEADAVLLLTPSAKAEAVAGVLTPQGRPLAEKDFSLPGESAQLEQYLRGLAVRSAMNRLKGAAAFPRIDWNIHIYRPATSAAPGGISVGDRVWAPARSVTVKDKDASITLDGPALLLFSFSNASRDDYYLYLVNYTDDGLLLPVLPPLETPGLETRAARGSEFSPSMLRLMLESPVEKLRLIVSSVPLDITGLAQDGSPGAKTPAASSESLPPALPENFSSVEAVFILGGQGETAQ